MKRRLTRRGFMAGAVALTGCAGKLAEDAGTRLELDGGATTDGFDAGRGPRDAGSADAGGSCSVGRAPGTFVHTFRDACALAAGTSLPIASGANGLTVSVSPDLPPGRVLDVDGQGVLRVVSASQAPATDTLEREWVIEVLDSPLAQIFNRTQGKTYGKNSASGKDWYHCQDEASEGDLIEISPGALYANIADADGSSHSHYHYFQGLDNCTMPIWKTGTIKSLEGRGRWRLLPVGTALPASYSGITIFEPRAVGGRKTIVLEGFDVVDQYGINRDAYGVRIRHDPGADWARMHQSVTFRNFKVGKTVTTGGSGFNNGAEVLVFENGHVFDCGWSGYEHNFYVSARSVTMRGVRSSRTRGGLDGHIFKTRAANTHFEGCVFDASGDADNTDVVQLANGGNHVFTGCLFIQGARPSANNGIIVYENEQAGNQPWYYGVDGHSLSIRGCVFISRALEQYGKGCPFVSFRPDGQPNSVRPSTLVLKDNIGANKTLAPALWLANTSAGPWDAENSIERYDDADSQFTNVELLEYARRAGPLPGSTLSTQRFQFPHGSKPRADSNRGLG